MYSKKNLLKKLLATIIAGQFASNSLAFAEATKNSTISDIDEVVVIKRRESDYSVITEQAQKIVEVPGAMGDPLMAVFSLPGVLAKGESGPPAVRGSSPSDNRYMVDGAPAGYVFHAFSTSIFNENILQDFQIYSAGFGPSYGNAVGGVFDIRLRDPKHQPFTTKVDVTGLRAGFFVESEISENSAFYLSMRKSLLQYMLDEQSKKDIEKEDGIRVQTAPQDSDYQFKYAYELDNNNKITLSANGATDLAEADFLDLSTEVLEDPDMAGGAQLKNHYKNAFIDWKYIGDQGSQFDLQVGQYVNNSDTRWGGKDYFFGIQGTDTYVIGHYDNVWNEAHTLSIGAELHRTKYEYNARIINYVCTETDPDCLYRRGDLINATDDFQFNETMFYLNDHWSINDSLAVDIGEQTHSNSLTKETFFNPRAAVSWDFHKGWTLSSSIGAYDRLPDMDKVFPDIGNPGLKSLTSNHFTLGIKQELGAGWSWSATGYYKTMDDLPLAMAEDEVPNYTNNVEGRAYGLDVFINKELTDRWYGWIALSTSKSTRTNKLTHKETNYFLDTPVVLNLVANYKVNDKWTVGGRFSAQTGRAFTPIIGAQKNPYFANHIFPIYGEAFSDNLPSYSRLDLRLKRETTFWGYQGAWTLDVLNALNRRNVTDRHLDYKRTQSPQNYKLEDEVGLGIIPAAGISVTF